MLPLNSYINLAIKHTSKFIFSFSYKALLRVEKYVAFSLVIIIYNCTKQRKINYLFPY